MTTEPMLDVLGSVSALFVAASLLFAGAAISHRLLPRASVSTWLGGAAVAALWLAAAFFHLLAFAGLFNAPCALGCAVVSASVLGMVSRRDASFAAHVRLLVHAARQVPGRLRANLPAALLVGACAASFALRVARSLVAPPMGHDALMYHLVKAGWWVQTGGFVFEEAPDAWTYLQWVPYMGSVFFAWSMLPFNGDHLVGSAGAVIWLAGVLGSYSVARQWGADKMPALLLALAIGFIPACAGSMTSGFVDHMSLSVHVLGLALLVHAWREGSWGAGVLSIAAFALGVGIKITAAPTFLAASAVVLLAMVLKRVPAQAWTRTFAGCTLAALVFVPVYAQTWVHRGSPTYPYELGIAGHRVFEGNQLLSDMMRGKYSSRASLSRPASKIFAMMFWEHGTPKGRVHCNLGPAMPPLIVAGIAGLFLLMRKKELRLPALVALLTVAAMVASFVSEDFRGQRASFLNIAGRLLLPAVASAVLGLAILPRRILLVLLSVALLVELPYTTGPGIGALDLAALREMGFALAVLCAVALPAGFLAARLSKGRAKALAVAAPMVLVGLLAWTNSIAMRHRHPIWSGNLNTEGKSYDFYPMAAAFQQAGWLAVDQSRGLRLAVTAGRDRLGHNWLRYPLMGSRLQNEIFYVPVTADGSVVDYENEDVVRASASYDAWLRRLHERNVDAVVALRPPCIEREWMLERPEVFAPVVQDAGNYLLVFALRKDADAEVQSSPASERPPR